MIQINGLMFRNNVEAGHINLDQIDRLFISNGSYEYSFSNLSLIFFSFFRQMLSCVIMSLQQRYVLASM